MKAIAELEQEQASEPLSQRTTIETRSFGWKEGLIGFSGCKDFVLMAKPEIAPFQMLKCINAPDISFLVLNRKVLVPNYYDFSAGARMGIHRDHRLSNGGWHSPFRSSGARLREGSANLQAPLLMNYEAMIARQVILTDSGFSFRHPLSRYGSGRPNTLCGCNRIRGRHSLLHAGVPCKQFHNQHSPPQSYFLSLFSP